MNAISKLDWQAPARTTEATALWSCGRWVVSAGGLSERGGSNAVAAESLADLREDGLLTWPLLFSSSQAFDLDSFMLAFKKALRLHGYDVQPDVLKRFEKSATALQEKLVRQAKAASARRRQRQQSTGWRLGGARAA
jgi:hypothetical protein